MNFKNIFIIYIVIVNIIAFAIYAIDKRKAMKNKRRISESTLLTVAILGGSAGALAAMNLCRHKTQKIKFSVGVPLIIVLQIAAIVYFTKI